MIPQFIQVRGGVGIDTRKSEKRRREISLFLWQRFSLIEPKGRNRALANEDHLCHHTSLTSSLIEIAGDLRAWSLHGVIRVDSIGGGGPSLALRVCRSRQPFRFCYDGFSWGCTGVNHRFLAQAILRLIRRQNCWCLLL